MKYFSLVAIVILLLNGCGKDVKHITYELEKNGALTVDTVIEILEKDFLGSKAGICNYLNYSCEGQTGEINNPYYMGFNFKEKNFNFEEDAPYGLYVTDILVADLCSVGKKDSFKGDYNFIGEGSLDKNKQGYLYISIEKMQERGFIDSSLKSKGDICLYVNATYEKMSEIVKYESNTIVYSVQEINNVLAEYEVLQ